MGFASPNMTSLPTISILCFKEKHLSKIRCNKHHKLCQVQWLNLALKSWVFFETQVVWSLQLWLKVSESPSHLWQYSLFVRHHDDENGRDAAQDDDDGQGQQRPLCVAHRLCSLLHSRHNVRRTDLQNPSSLTQVRLELFIDVQNLPIQKPSRHTENIAAHNAFIESCRDLLHNME